MKRLILIYNLILILSACTATGESLTLEANYALAGTQVEELRTTATVQAARAETTLDFMGTRAVVSENQSNFLVETLVATGISPQFLATQREDILGSSPTPLPTAIIGESVTEAVSPGRTQLAETLTPSPPAVTINAPNPTSTAFIQATADLGRLTTGNLITTRGAGNDGCGVSVTSVFGMDVTEIYVILPVFNLVANQYTFAAHWQKDAQAIGPVYDFTPDFDSESLCVWFFVDSTDFPFEPGSYSVRIDINGQPAQAAVPFIIQ